MLSALLQVKWVQYICETDVESPMLRCVRCAVLCVCMYDMMFPSTSVPASTAKKKLVKGYDSLLDTEELLDWLGTVVFQHNVYYSDKYRMRVIWC